MRSVVMGLFMLAGSVVREPGQSLDDQDWRQGGGGAEAVNEDRGSEGVVKVTAGPAFASMPLMSGDSNAAADDEGDGAWDVACERKRGNHLLFDRQSVRELGGTTLFRWAPADGEAPVAGAAVYTAVADCRAKSIEARWPGKRTQTRAGTCGRHMVEAVCAVSASAKAER
jgi:hypothetical protein